MNTTKLRGFLLFVLFCGLGCIVSVKAQSYKVTLTRFVVNQPTNEGLRASDGAGDEVMVLSRSGTVDSSGRWSQPGFRFADSSVIRGLQTENLLSVTLFEGIIGTNDAAVIIPTIWEIDDLNNLDLGFNYDRDLNSSRSNLGTEVASMIRTPPPLRLDKYLRSGLGLRINTPMSLAGGIPQDRPIGMHTTGTNQFGFTPQALVLTSQSADFISRNDLAGKGIGVVPVSYVDASGMGGNYTLLLKVEQEPPTCQPVTSTFTGRAELTIENPRTPDPFIEKGFSLVVEFTECSNIRITKFSPIVNVSQNPPNTSTITMASGGAGNFTPTSGALNIPITLLFENTNTFLGNSTLSLVLTGEENSSGSVTFEGRGTFAGGGLNGNRARLRITNGSFSPRPR